MAKRYRLREDNVSVVDSRIAKYQADELSRWMELNYSAFKSMDYKGIQIQPHDVTFKVVRDSSNRYRVIASGSRILYDEFGTGEIGKKNPHPEKSRYSLNDYNSGEYVSRNIDKYGRHYWFYNNFITYGQPAGMFVYNSIRVMSDGIAREIAVREIKKENKKLLHL